MLDWSDDVDVEAFFFTAADRHDDAGVGSAGLPVPLVWGHRSENQIQDGAAEQNYETTGANHPVGPTFSHEQESKANERDGYETPRGDTTIPPRDSLPHQPKLSNDGDCKAYRKGSPPRRASP